MGWLEHEEKEILLTVRNLKKQVADLQSSHNDCCKQLNDKLDQILRNTAPPPVAAFQVTTTILANDGSVQQGGDLVDNGTAKYVATPVDAAGDQVDIPAGSAIPSWASSDDTTIQVTPDTTDASGLTAVGKPLKLGTGVVATITMTTTNATVSGSSDPLNVIAGPPTGFVVGEH